MQACAAATISLNHPPPLPAIPEINLSGPKIAIMTLKERIEDHRNHAACLSCHQKIDLRGIALENYDALGRWHDQIGGRNVDATSVLPNIAKLDGIRGLKEHVMQDRQEQFVRATLENMVMCLVRSELFQTKQWCVSGNMTWRMATG